MNEPKLLLELEIEERRRLGKLFLNRAGFEFYLKRTLDSFELELMRYFANELSENEEWTKIKV